MPNLKDRILDVVKAPCLAGFATITKDGKPWVRYVITEASDDLTFRFSSFVNVRKVAQIQGNPEAHLTCGITHLTEMGPYLQIQGRAEFATDREARVVRALEDGAEPVAPEGVPGRRCPRLSHRVLPRRFRNRSLGERALVAKEERNQRPEGCPMSPALRFLCSFSDSLLPT